MENLISFETAKLLAKTSFEQENCENGYETATGEPSSDYNCDWMNGVAIAAPTLSELQTWLRSKKLVVYVTPVEVSASTTRGIRFVWDICDYSGSSLDSDNSPLGYLEYEHALEIGLQHTLKLIK